MLDATTVWGGGDWATSQERSGELLHASKVPALSAITPPKCIVWVARVRTSLGWKRNPLACAAPWFLSFLTQSFIVLAADRAC